MWKSDSQGIKEETLTQPGRRGRDRQPGGEDLQQGGGWWTGWAHIRLRINREEWQGSETDRRTQGSSVGE